VLLVGSAAETRPEGSAPRPVVFDTEPVGVAPQALMLSAKSITPAARDTDPIASP
jgi:hypothetical protein